MVWARQNAWQDYKFNSKMQIDTFVSLCTWWHKSHEYGKCALLIWIALHRLKIFNSSVKKKRTVARLCRVLCDEDLVEQLLLDCWEPMSSRYTRWVFEENKCVSSVNKQIIPQSRLAWVTRGENLLRLPSEPQTFSQSKLLRERQSPEVQQRYCI